MSALEIMYPTPEAIEVQGRTVMVYPVKLRHLEQYGKTAGALVDLFSRASTVEVSRYAAKNAREIRKLLLVTTSLKRWQLWLMPSAICVQVLAEVVRVNTGFFVDALPAMVRALSGPLSPSA